MGPPPASDFTRFCKQSLKHDYTLTCQQITSLPYANSTDASSLRDILLIVAEPALRPRERKKKPADEA
jgi:hypothetical protein